MRLIPHGAAAAAALALTLADPAAIPAQESALTVTEVVELHRNGVSPQQIVRIAQQYCIAFSVDDSLRGSLTGSGVGVQVVDALARACVARPAAPAAVLLVQDDFSGPLTFAAPDGRCSAESGPGGLRLTNSRSVSGCSLPYPAGPMAAPVRIELAFTRLAGEPVGTIVLGFSRDESSGDLQTVGITSTGDVELGETRAGRFRQMKLLARSATVHADTVNHLALEIRDGTVRVLVNGRLVDTYPAPSALRQGIMLGVGPRSSVTLTGFRVQQPQSIAARD